MTHARPIGRCVLLALLLVLLVGGRVDRDRARGGGLVRAAVLHQHAARSESVPVVLGLERELDARRAAALHLDGRDPVPHEALGGDVRRARAVARLAAGAADARERARLRDLRHGVGLVGRDLRDHRQGGAAGADSAAATTRRRASARSAAPARSASCCRPRSSWWCTRWPPRSRSSRCSSPASCPGFLLMALVLRLHHRLGAAQSAARRRAKPSAFRFARSSTAAAI